MKSRVILIAPILRFDTEKASPFGDIVYLFDDVKVANPFNGQSLLAEMVRRLENLRYEPGADLIALTGPVAVVAMLALAAAEVAGDGLVSTLIYDARDGGSYRRRDLEPVGS